MGAIFFVFQIRGSGRLRRGQDPSLRSNRYMGGNGKAAGCRKWVADERGKGGRQPTPFAVGGGCPGMDGDARPVGTLQASLRGQLP